MPELLCVGNPLVDLHAQVPAELLDRYQLAPPGAVQAEERHLPLPDELLRSGDALNLELAPGGGAGTACAVAAALSAPSSGDSQRAGAPRAEAPYTCALLGGIAGDELGAKLRELLRSRGVVALLSETDAVGTGWRAVLRSKGQERSSRDGLGPPPGEEASAGTGLSVTVATFAGAAREYKLDHLRFKVWETVEAARVIYIEGLFLTVSPDSARILAEHCAKMQRILCLNLSARYLCGFFHDRIMQMLPYVDYLFGSESEFMDLSEHHRDEAGSTIDEVATWIARMPRADGDTSRKRSVVVTCGTRPAVVASTWRGFGVKVQRFPVPPVKSGRFVCKAGSGDAFVGGFLHGLLCETDLDGCMLSALYAAHVLVQRAGPAHTFKDKPQLDRVQRE